MKIEKDFLYSAERKSKTQRAVAGNRLCVHFNYRCPIDPSNLIKQFRQLLKKAGLSKIRFHDLQHTAASLMLNNGVNVLVASQRLGHAKLSITLDVYGHLVPAIQNKAAEVLDQIVSL